MAAAVVAACCTVFEIWNPEIWCEANFPALEPGVVNRVEGDSWYAQGVDAKSGEW